MFVLKSPGLSIGALAIVALGIGLLVGMQFQHAPARGEAEQKPPSTIPEPAVTEKQPESKAKPATETAQRQPESAPTVATIVAGEPVYDAIPGAEAIPNLTGPELVIVPADPNKPRAEQVEWRYIPLFRLEEAKYDRDKKILICRIDSRLSAQTKDRVYARLREITGAPAQTAFRLNPVRLQTLTVELAVLDKKVVLRAERSGHDIANGPIPVLYRVKEDELHDLLSTNLRDLTLTVRSTHPYAAFTRDMMQVESSMTAVREAFEKVLPKGMKLEDLEKHPLIVDRDSMLQLQQALREEFRVRVEGNPVKFAGLDKVLDKMLDRITVSNVPLHEVTRDMTDNFVVWDTKTARLDVAPNERTRMTRELEESEENKKSYKFIWDKAQETLRKSGDAETWHNTLHDEFKLHAELSVGVKLFSGSAKMNLEKRFDQSTEGSKQASREAFDKIKNSGEKWEDSFSKSYRKFKGEDWEKSAAGKILRLQRVTNLNVVSFRSAVLEHVRRMSKGMLERVTVLPLEPSNTQQADALREIELMKQKVAALQTEMEQREIDELGTMKPWFSTKLPKGWVWADGVATFPNADWVPMHLRGAKVPNMQEYLVGGAKDEHDVGGIYDKGKLTVPEFTIKGESFTLPAQREGRLRIAAGAGRHPFNKGGMVVVIREPHGDNQDGKRGFFWDGWGASYEICEAQYEAFNPEQNLRGSKKINEQPLSLNTAGSNPRHVMCRWIIFVGVE
jgi:hypothetical protein